MSLTNRLLRFLTLTLLASVSVGWVFGQQTAASMSIVSGNGQIVQEQFGTQVPMVVQAKTAAGTPAVNVPVTWTLNPADVGTIRPTGPNTDNAGQSSAFFVGSYLQAGYSFRTATVTVTAGSASTTLYATVILGRGLPLPLIYYTAPPIDNRNLTGRAGSTIPGAIAVLASVASGPQSGFALPNVGVRIFNPDSDPAANPSGVCDAPGGLAITDATGVAVCNLVLNTNPGTARIEAEVGEIIALPGISLTIQPGTCTFQLSTLSLGIGSAGGNGSVSVVAPSGCGWTAASNDSWLSITSGTPGNGNGTINFTVAANSGAARQGTLTVAGDTFVVNQTAAGGPGPLTISSPANLPSAILNSPYSTTLGATGGTPPYTWSITGNLPAGLTLNPTTGAIAGTPTAPGTFTFQATVTDASNTRQLQGFTLAVQTTGSSLTITTTSLPNGAVGTPYSQGLTSSGGCVTPFSPAPVFNVISGSLPPGLTLRLLTSTYGISGTPTSAGTYNFTVGVSDSCGHGASQPLSITITGSTSSGPVLSATPVSLGFTVVQGATTAPANQSVALAAGSQTLGYTMTATTTSGGQWLAPTGGTTGQLPITLQFGIANFSALAPGIYSGSIVITSQGASNSPLTIPVTLTVTPSQPSLAVSPLSLAFRVLGGGAAPQPQGISLGGPAPIGFTAQSATADGGHWLTVSPASGTTPATVAVSVNQNGLAPGGYVGAITLTAPGVAPLSVSVTLLVTAPPMLSVGPTALAFTYQQGSTAPGSQYITVGSTGDSLPFTVQAATTNGGPWLAVSPASASTPLSISVTVNPANLTPGLYSGQINVVSSGSAAPAAIIPVTLTVRQVPVNVGAITNAASFNVGPIAPGEIITIFGSNLGSTPAQTLQLDSTGLVATKLGATRVLFDGIAAPMVYAAPQQISAIVPFVLYGRVSTQLQVESNGTLSPPLTLNLVDSAPGIFLLDNTGQGAILNQDGSVNGPQNGADPGSVVAIYATGGGVFDQPVIDGQITTDITPKLRLPVTVTIGGLNADLFYSGGAPGLPAGAMQVNARIPASAPRGQPLPVVITVGSASSQAKVTVFVR